MIIIILTSFFKFEITNSVCYLSSRFVPVYTLQLGLCIYM